MYSKFWMSYQLIIDLNMIGEHYVLLVTITKVSVLLLDPYIVSAITRSIPLGIFFCLISALNYELRLP